MPGNDRKVGHPNARRVQVVEPVRTRFPRFGEFVTQYSTNMSMTGMFLRSDNPQPPGTRFDFEFVISDESPMIRGSGVVVWVRESEESAERPAGMGVRFLDLEPNSRRVIRWLMENAAAQGQETFQLGEEPALSPDEKVGWRASKTAAPVNRDHIQSASSMRNRQVRAKSRRRADLVALALIALIVLGWWVVRSLNPAATERSDEAAGTEMPAVAEPAPTAGGPDGAPAASRGSDATETDAILAAVRGWAQAWSERDTERYLTYYSEALEPPRGMTREQWEGWRRERLAAPGYIRVALTDFEVENLEEATATVSFFQSYRSDLMDETIRKRVTLIREEEAWKILRESPVAGLD